MGRRVELIFQPEYHPSREHMVRALQIVLSAPVVERKDATAAYDIATGGCAAREGRTQAAAASLDESLSRPAVE